MHKKISYGGIVGAIGAVFLLLSAYVPSGKAALLFMASVVLYMLAIITDKKTAFICYGVTSIIAFFFAASASPVIVCGYIICFGNYPVLRLLLDEKNRILSLGLKAFLYLVYFLGVYFACKTLAGVSIPYGLWLLLPLGAPVFVFYDQLLPKTAIYLTDKIFKSFL